MKSRFSILTAVFLLLFLNIASAQDELQFMDEFESCTSIMVAKAASADGSVITCHTCDGNYRTWVNIVPHQTFGEGDMLKIYWGNLHTETAWDLRRINLKGEIPQVPETYSYMNVAYPCLNEKQLGIGETTIGGRRELRNDDGLFLIENLQQVVLQRCTTAREAVKLIGQLVKQYGYGDSGECLTFADPKEVWHFEIMGAGPLEIGAVWAAVRIPDDHVGISANIPRISELNLKDPDHYMASDNVYSLAEEMGWWDPNSGEKFKFWKAYSGRRPFSDREFFVLNSLAPNLKLNMEMEELPFSVKPQKKLSVRDVMAFYRQTYEGTDFDMTKNLMVERRPMRRRRQERPTTNENQPQMIKSPIANPWMSRNMISLLNTIKPGTIETRRTIAISACSYSQIIQLRDWLPDEIGGVAWFSFDNPAQSPRIPIFSGTTELPKSFEIGGQHRYRTDAAIWSFRRANRLATVSWGQTKEYIEKAVMNFENTAFGELPAIEKKAQDLLKEENGKEKCQEYLTNYTNNFAYSAMSKWQELGDTFWGFFSRGF